jgi:hypothetical protein
MADVTPPGEGPVPMGTGYDPAKLGSLSIFDALRSYFYEPAHPLTKTETEAQAILPVLRKTDKGYVVPSYAPEDDVSVRQDLICSEGYVLEVETPAGIARVRTGPGNTLILVEPFQGIEAGHEVCYDEKDGHIKIVPTVQFVPITPDDYGHSLTERNFKAMDLIGKLKQGLAAPGGYLSKSGPASDTDAEQAIKRMKLQVKSRRDEEAVKALVRAMLRDKLAHLGEQESRQPHPPNVVADVRTGRVIELD